MAITMNAVGSLYSTTRKELGSESLQENEDKQLFNNYGANEKEDFVDKVMNLARKLPADAIKATGSVGIVGSSISILAGLKAKNFKAVKYGTAALFGSVVAYLTGKNLPTLQQVSEVNQEVEQEKEEPTTTYTVKPKETLYSLAKKYNTTVDNLKNLNGLTDNTIKIGMKLIVPDTGVIEDASEERKQTTYKQMQNTTTYKVGKQETLYKIATEHGISVEQLRELNNLDKDDLKIGQELVVPAKSEGNKTQTGAKANLYKTTTHKVVKKETLYHIATEYGITVEQLKKLNNMKNNALKVGQELIVPEKTDAQLTKSNKTTTHKVATKETLYHIASEYGTTVEQLMKLNNMKNNDLKVGQELIVPQK